MEQMEAEGVLDEDEAGRMDQDLESRRLGLQASHGLTRQ